MTDPAFEPPVRVVVSEVSESYKRRPDYAEDATGIVERVHGEYFPANADETEFLYAVRFDPDELWEEPEWNQAIYIDLWESALSPADGVSEPENEQPQP